MTSPNPKMTETTPRNPRDSVSWWKGCLLLALGSVAGIGGITLLGLWQTGQRLQGMLQGWFRGAAPPPQVDLRTPIIRQIEGLSELTTAVFVMEAVVPVSQDRALGGVVLGTTQLLYIARGEVRAGVDLSQLQASHIQVNDDHLRLQLPPAQILDRKIDVERSRVYDYDRGFFHLGPDVAPQLQSLAQQQTLMEITRTACDAGLLDEANQRAKLAITQLFLDTRYHTIDVDASPSTPETCRMEAP